MTKGKIFIILSHYNLFIHSVVQQIYLLLELHRILPLHFPLLFILQSSNSPIGIPWIFSVLFHFVRRVEAIVRKLQWVNPLYHKYRFTLKYSNRYRKYLRISLFSLPIVRLLAVVDQFRIFHLFLLGLFTLQLFPFSIPIQIFPLLLSLLLFHSLLISLFLHHFVFHSPLILFLFPLLLLQWLHLSRF